MLEALIDTGVHMGLPRNVATKLVSKTFQGSIQYFVEAKNQHPVQMRNDITSPGGMSTFHAAWAIARRHLNFRTHIQGIAIQLGACPHTNLA